MFRTSMLLMIAAICLPALAEEQTAPPEIAQEKQDDMPKTNRFVSCKCAFLGANDKGKIEVAVIVQNKSDEAVWLPRSFESKNISVDISSRSGSTIEELHIDGGLCSFPGMYFKLAPDKFHVYTFELPWNKLERGLYTFEIWAPWRDRKESDKNVPIEERIEAKFDMKKFLDLQEREND